MRPVPAGQELVISGFSADGWVVSERLYIGTLLITAERAWALPPAGIEELDAAAMLKPLAELAARPGLLLLGTGEKMRRPPAEFIAEARAQGLTVEFMDSRAAARTYNVLITEQRPVAALLL